MSKDSKVMGLVLIIAVVASVPLYLMPAKVHTTPLSDTVMSVRSAVVHIDKPGEWQGSGFVIAEDGLIVTAKHVVEGGGTFIITMDDGTKYTTNVAVTYKDYDVGFLKIDPNKPLPVVRLGNIRTLNPGDPVFIMGSPLGFDNFNSVTLGIISARQRNLDEKYNEGYGWTVTFQSDAAAYPGNSGGPVFNMQGEAVGVLVAGMDACLNYSVPTVVFMNEIDVLKAVIESTQFEVLTTPEPEVFIPVDYLGMIIELQDQINDLQRQIDALKPIDPNTVGGDTDAGCVL